MFPVPLLPDPGIAVVHVAFEWSCQLTAESVGPPLKKRKLESVKVADAVPEIGPVAVTVYVATNQPGSWNSSRIVPLPSAMPSTSRRQDSPASSFTRMWTISPGCQLLPVKITAPPGG